MTKETDSLIDRLQEMGERHYGVLPMDEAIAIVREHGPVNERMPEEEWKRIIANSAAYEMQQINRKEDKHEWLEQYVLHVAKAINRAMLPADGSHPGDLAKAAIAAMQEFMEGSVQSQCAEDGVLPQGLTTPRRESDVKDTLPPNSSDAPAHAYPPADLERTIQRMVSVDATKQQINEANSVYVAQLGKEQPNTTQLNATSSEMPDNEDIARFVYVAMQWAVRHAENGRYTPDWQEHGNSHAQEEARRCASVILTSKRAPVLGNPETMSKCPICQRDTLHKFHQCWNVSIDCKGCGFHDIHSILGEPLSYDLKPIRAALELAEMEFMHRHDYPAENLSPYLKAFAALDAIENQPKLVVEPGALDESTSTDSVVDLEDAVSMLWNNGENSALGDYDSFKHQYPNDCKAQGAHLWRWALYCAEAWRLKWK